MDQNHSSVTLLRATGVGMSVAGGIAGLSGVVLAPFTGGASLVTSVGAAASFLGNFTRMLASGAELAGNSKCESRVCRILQACEEELLALKDSYEKVQQSMRELEKEKDLKQSYRDAASNMIQSFNNYGPPLKTEMFKFILRRIVHLSVRFMARIITEKMSKEEAQTPIVKMVEFATAKFPKGSTTQVGRDVVTPVASALFHFYNVHNLYTDLTHFREDAPSEIAKQIRNVAEMLDGFIDSQG
ncbi:hypothetical protein NDU88_004460 [Pleurodeles waltl]|uniref:Uncharacterized protein n=1 Tax=Pleurodeles waltl TaxID=8319 RepID=A0AAV7V3M3_PLEWA|nr:hypothetical protein NDU88_004460 [Pleurodeles waltl]